MFTVVYTFLFIFFLGLGFFIGKRYQESFMVTKTISLKEEKKSGEMKKTDVPPPSLLEQDSLGLASQYVTISKAEIPLSYVGISKEKLDLIVLKKQQNLSPLEQHMRDLINDNQVYFRIIVTE